MSNKPDLSTLPQRMRYAADVLREADLRYGAAWSWSPDGLEINADKWEDKDREAANREALVEELAAEMYASAPNQIWLGKSIPPAYLESARHLIESGWGKGDSA